MNGKESPYSIQLDSHLQLVDFLKIRQFEQRDMDAVLRLANEHAFFVMYTILSPVLSYQHAVVSGCFLTQHVQKNAMESLIVTMAWNFWYFRHTSEGD